MPRQPRIEYPDAIYHVMSRGDRRENIFFDDIDRQDFLKTLAETCAKADFQVHAFCLMPNHFHLVVETPNANLVAGMRWLLSSYTLRLNHRRKLTGHVFSGRYKAHPVDGSGNGYLKTVCDYVHLNPVRARMLGPDDRLTAFPWSSLPWHLAARDHRPAWIRTDRLLAEHGLLQDTPAARQEFERRLEDRRRQEAEKPSDWSQLQHGWCVGSDAFQQKLLEMIAGTLGGSHSGALKRESAEAKAERIVAEELHRLAWTESDLAHRLKGDPAKLAIAHRLRTETTLTVKRIAERLHLGTAKSARPRLRRWQRDQTPEANALPGEPQSDNESVALL